MATGGKVLRTYTAPDGARRHDVEDDDGETRHGLTDDDLEPEEEAQAEAAKPASQATDVKFFQYELEAGIATINEIRASKGLPRDERFANMTLPEYLAAHADTYQLATLARSASAAAGEIEPAPAEEAAK